MKFLIPFSIGLFFAITTILIHSLLTWHQQLELMSSLMVLIGSVYFGFALKTHNKTASWIETMVAISFVIMGISGLWVSPWILAAALLLHGFWDLIHHNPSKLLASIPKWYVPFCATYDWIMGGYLIYIFLKQ